jgi:peptidyl-prolyl cis-trans isomerase SurA
MKKNIVLLVNLILIGALSFGQKNDPVLMTINGVHVHESEFLNIYTKNNPEPKLDKESLDEYLALFVKYKLKVTEAEELKMDTAPSFVQELGGYRQQLEAPYLIDKEMNKELVKEAYDRSVSEVKAAHILIQDVNAKEAVRQGKVVGKAEYNKMMEIRKEILAGKITFAAAALKYSQDPSVKQNEGMLGYFSAFQMVYPFEEGVFTTEVGDMSMPIKTRFGYHLIKVYDKRVARGQIKVAHIYAKAPGKSTPEEIKKAKSKIEEIYALLKKGRKFEELAKEYSEDKTSAKKGGELDWFGTGRMLPQFEEASYALKSNGDYSEPIQTSYGWHIIKKLDYKELPTFEEKESDLKNRIAKGVRGQKSKESFVNKLKTEYYFKDYSSKWFANYSKDLSDSLSVLKYGDKNAFRYSKKKGWFAKKNKIKIAEFSKYLEAHPSAIEVDIKAKYDIFVGDKLLAYEKSRLEVKYPEYKALMQEYKDGILLFELTDKKVWKKASQDTLGLQAFYEANKENYTWKKRADVEIYTSVKKDMINKAHYLVKDSSFNANQVLTTVNKDSQLNLSVESGKYEIEEKKELKGKDLKSGVFAPFVLDSKFVFLRVNETLPVSIKELNDTKGLVISDYQNHLETEWIKELKIKYPVKVNEDILYSVGK